MKLEHISLKVPGQKTGEAGMNLYLLDPISIAPEKKRPMVVIIPGGGYSRKADREAEPIAMQFLAMHCHACVLDYSVAPNHFPVSLREAALAVAYIREHAAEWQVNPDAILVCGFSAGGHLACSLGTFYGEKFVTEAIGRTEEEVRPDGMILCYPVISSGEHAHERSIRTLLGDEAYEANLPEIPDSDGEERALPLPVRDYVSLENRITPAFPPTFLWHTVPDETVPVENSLLLASALQKAKVNFELHIFPEGRHGLSLAAEETAGSRENSVVPCCQSWISLVKLWIETRFI